MKRQTRGQTSLEFMVLIGFMFIIFVIFFVTIQERTVDLSRQRDQMTLREIDNILKSELRSAESFSNGYRRDFFLPPLVYGRGYYINISLDHGEIYFNLSGNEYIDFLDNMTYGNVTRGWNTICKKDASVHVNNCSGVLN